MEIQLSNKQKSRIATMQTLKRADLIYLGGVLLAESIKDDEVKTNEEHTQLFNEYVKRFEEVIKDPNEAEASLFKITCWTKFQKFDCSGVLV